MPERALAFLMYVIGFVVLVVLVFKILETI